MDSDQSRIEEDLRGVLDGEVYCSPLRTQIYASDASLYEIVPLAVVRPRHAEDVLQCVRYASENSLPLFPRGGGTGLAGQSLGPGIVIDFSRFMRRLLHVDRDKLQVRVQPGMTLAEMNRALAKDRLIFGVDPPTRAVTTIGSVLAIDTLGSHFLKYGTAGEAIVSSEAVLSHGESVRMERASWRNPATGSHRLDYVVSEIGQLLWNNRAITKNPPWRGVARGCGYRLEVACDHDTVDLARLQSGAEGTLSVLTEATIRVQPMPNARAVVLMFFERLELAARAAIDARRDNVAACDLMDRRLIEIARELDPRYESMLPRGAEALLLIEQQGADIPEVRSRMGALIQRLVRRAPSTQHSRIVVDDAERDFIWKLSRRVIPRLSQFKGSSRPIPFVEDISIPPDRLPEFLVDVQNVLKSERVTGTLFAHAAHGHLHLRPFLDPHDPDDVVRMQHIADKIFEKVIEYRGVISGEHAVGLSRSVYLRQQLGELYPLCRRVKELFDPKGILNPGKLVTDAAQKTTDNLRPVSLVAQTETQLSQLQPQSDVSELAKRTLLPILKWDEKESMAFTANACNGCGRCRSNAPSERMCPMFRSTRGEEASPRAKANLVRGLLSGKLPVMAAESDEMKAIADLCFHCHQCRIECPASVDIPKLMLEIKGQYTATNGLRLSDRLLSRLDLLTALASKMPITANWALENRYARWILEKTTGIAQGRRLPKLAKQPFMRWASRQRLMRPNRGGGRKVLYLVDHYANWHNPIVGIALVQVLQHQNVEVYVPSWQSVTYMTKIVMGDIEKVRRMIAPQIRQLAESVRQGYQILTSEPSAALCLKYEYVQILDNEDARLVAANTWDAGHYLCDMHANNELELDFKPLTTSVIYHTPCHLRALDPLHSGMKLLRLIPGLTVQHADAGCSGMAGTYGIRRQTYRTSLRVGWGLISKMQETTSQIGSTECSTCKLQMEQGIDKPTIHPLALMAFAYGKLPEVRSWIQRRNDGLTVQ
jgi:FAD/FMN-containing dehydrogenase/Fe-S oxidoreductase